MLFNYTNLINRITERGETLESLSQKVGMSPKTLSSRLSNKTEFRASEIEKIAGALGIEAKELNIYFFWLVNAGG